MALSKKTVRNLENTGFSLNTASQGGRITNRDGSLNLVKVGMPLWTRTSIYHTLLRLSRFRFLMWIFFFYTMLNLFFATIYFFLGTESLEGAGAQNSWMTHFLAAFFFSSQTLTTVGYGHISPSSLAANVVASLESLLGILSFAVVTGLLYGRFTRPRAYLIFSSQILVAPFKGGKALMLRLTTYKNNLLTDAEATITMAMQVTADGQRANRFFTLDLDISKISSLALNWTLVHPITENSPLYGLTEQEIKDGHPELIVNVKAFDDHFSNIVQQRTSYTGDDLVYGARFLPMFHRSEHGHTTILDLQKLDDWERVPLPEPAAETNPA